MQDLFKDAIAHTTCPKCKAAPGEICFESHFLVNDITVKSKAFAPHFKRIEAFTKMSEYKPETYKRRFLYGTEVEVLGKGDPPKR